MNKLVVLSLFIFFISCNRSTSNNNEGSKEVAETPDPSDHFFLGKEHAKKQLREALKGQGEVFTWDTLIKTPSMGTAIAEPILFHVFGKEQILEEKPYEVYLIDGYWFLSGTIPTGSKGGGFEIILSAKDSKIIRLTHYK